MRYTLLLLLALSLACSKSEAPSSTATEIEPAAAAETEQAAVDEAQPSPVSAPPILEPTTRVLSPGDGDKSPLRFNFKAGTKEAIVVRTELSSTMPTGKSVRPPAMYEIELETKEVTDDGTARVAFQIADIEVSPTPDFPAAQLEALKGSLEKIKGKKGSYAVDSRGLIDAIELEDEAPGQDGIERLLQKLLERTTVILPEEEIGTGAQWVTERSYDDAGIRMYESAKFTLKKRKGRALQLEAELKLNSPEQVLTDGPGIPRGGSITLLGINGDGSISGNWDLGKLAPKSCTVKTKDSKRFAGPEGSGAEEPVELIFDTQITISRK
ncbi:MAG: hypothetical protein ACN4G0_14035 [Polyangiales bacterium]